MKCRLIAAAILVGTLATGLQSTHAQDVVDAAQVATRPTRQMPNAVRRAPRRGVPNISDALFSTASWLRPGARGQNLVPARFRPAHLRHRGPSQQDHIGHHQADHVIHPIHHAGHTHTRAAPAQHSRIAELTVNLDPPEPAPARQETVYEEVAGDVFADGACGYGACCHPNGTCDSCCLIPFPLINWDNLEVGFGVQGFTGPVNRGETGSFGVNQSLNLGTPTPILLWREIGGQFGVRGVQSNFSGAEFTSNERRQFFLTAGLFHRVDWGFQGGIVVDYLRDKWYAEADLTQIRGELSWVFPCSHEWGFWFNRHVRDETITTQVGPVGTVATVNEQWEATDVYAFFYRYRAEGIGGQAKLYGGFTGESDGIDGFDMRMPISERWDVDGGFAYLVPQESTGNRGHEQESWNVGINLIYYPGCRTSCDGDYYRPLFDVADNGTFFVDRR